jgi:hypothetical protein
MSRYRVTTLVVASFALVATARGTMAQSAAAALGLALERQGGGVWQSATRLDPSLRFTNPWFSLRSDLSVTKASLTSPLVAGDGRFELVAQSPVWRGFELSTDAHVDRFASLPGIEPVTTIGHAESTVSFRAGSSGAWLGLGVERPWRTDSVSSRASDRPLFSAGFWRQFHALTLSVGTEVHSLRFNGRASNIVPAHDSAVTDSFRPGRLDTIRVPERINDLGPVTRFSRWSDLTARLSWAGGPLALDATTGFSPRLESSPATMWGYATATVAVASRLSLIAAAGADASRVWLSVPKSRFVNLGIRISPASLARPAAPPHVRPMATSFALRQDGGAYVVSLRVPSARSVELSGDFNDWKAVRLREVRPDVWEAAIALTPGTHRVNMRVNGDAWTAPPGLAATSDEFNGTVGLLVVP